MLLKIAEDFRVAFVSRPPQFHTLCLQQLFFISHFSCLRVPLTSPLFFQSIWLPLSSSKAHLCLFSLLLEYLPSRSILLEQNPNSLTQCDDCPGLCPQHCTSSPHSPGFNVVYFSFLPFPMDLAPLFLPLHLLEILAILPDFPQSL